jgi:heme exporter protein C
MKIIKMEWFYNNAVKIATYSFLGAGILLSYGLLSGLFVAPIDYQQKEAVRIMYVHVPCAILSLTIYTIIGCMSVIYLIWKIKLADIIAKVSAPIGAMLTFIALLSGALWGKPMWGTWWVWDARLTSELILLFLYFGYIGLRSALNDQRMAASLCAIVAIVGLVDIPIIHFSVDWWHTLHQGASISRFAKPSIAIGMLYPLISVLAALYLFYIAIVCISARTEIMWRERNAKWLSKVVGGGLVNV